MSGALFYGFKDQERLDGEPSDTAQRLIDQLGKGETLEFPIKVFEYKQDELWAKNNLESYANDILDNLLERLDDEHGDPNSNGTEPSEDMKKAALELTKAIVKDYYVFSCSLTGKVIEFNEEDMKYFSF